MKVLSKLAMVVAGIGLLTFCAEAAPLGITNLRTEWLTEPQALETFQPRLSWEVTSPERGQKQTAYRIIASSSEKNIINDQGDVWDTGVVHSDETLNIVYAGQPLLSGQKVFWKVKTWDKDRMPSEWSTLASWACGLNSNDWKAEWISFRDAAPLPHDRAKLFLPPAHCYRKEFEVKKRVKRAMVYATALGLCDLYLNGNRVSDYFEPGWSDYHQRAYYRAHDVTDLLNQDGNALGAVVGDGWYAGYVGYGLLVGYGPNKSGCNLYGKTPAFMVQLEILYTDGSVERIGTDTTWRVTDRGPVREADIIMGESYDAREELGRWTMPGYFAHGWKKAIRAEANGSTKAIFSDTRGDREVELGFQEPVKLQAYTAPPIRVTQELKTQHVTEPKPGVYIFDLGQNFAGVIRLQVKGPRGTRVQLRYGEHLHDDGTLMTENLRKARATDSYILRGDRKGETWSPRFTYHGFQYVEVTGLPFYPAPEIITGLVLQSDTPMVGSFSCSDPVMTKFAENAKWTQRANFIEIPTDCPQRDERLGWMGDAQTYIRTATFNADVAAFFTKWLDDVQEAQQDFGAYPDYCPYPMSHGAPGKTFGTAWTDAGVICPWTIWKVYDDTRVIDRHWESLTRFMDWRAATMATNGLGVSIGNTWGDWLNVNESTPIEFIDTCYHALDCQMMTDMAEATHRTEDANRYRERFEFICAAFDKAYVNKNGTLKVDTQTAYVLALWTHLIPEELTANAANVLAKKIAHNGNHMSTGFLGTRALLPVLSSNGHADLALKLFQSREFPSWGYEVVNGANSVWERWDSYTKEHGFNGSNGHQNASMNSFSHYSFGAVMEWAMRYLAGVDTLDAGYKHILIQPGMPMSSGTNTIDWVKSTYHSARGNIAVSWRKTNHRFELNVTIPANTTADVELPIVGQEKFLRESGSPVTADSGIHFMQEKDNLSVMEVPSGEYHFSGKISE